MFKIIKKQIRPSTTIDFYTITDNELISWLVTNYFQTGKMIPAKITISENGLEQTTTVLFQSEEAAREWKYDPVIAEKLHTPMEAYCAANGIEILPTITIGEV